jgi:hypothetical protein
MEHSRQGESSVYHGLLTIHLVINSFADTEVTTKAPLSRRNTLLLSHPRSSHNLYVYSSLFDQILQPILIYLSHSKMNCISKLLIVILAAFSEAKNVPSAPLPAQTMPAITHNRPTVFTPEDIIAPGHNIVAVPLFPMKVNVNKGVGGNNLLGNIRANANSV